MKVSLRKGRHSVTTLYVHLVFVPKYRRQVFNADSLKLLEESFNGVAGKMGFKLIEFNGESDHVHLLVEYPPRLSISALVNHLKGVSSRMYRKQFQSPHPEHLWSPSYFASSCPGAPIEVLKKYVQDQKSP
ncbi:MAG: IS200/IS605 family transposase [Symploca sp. SIO2E9]|nr:IS200/IS605 family transposase [Symploca sp. SIO2E9]